MIGPLADSLARGVEQVAGTVSETFFEPVVRLGVTGLARSGKTVFITSLVANLIDRARMPQLSAAAQGRISAAYLQPQPDDTLPRFDYETHLGRLMANEPSWPESTRAISELRLSFNVRAGGFLGSVQGPRRVHLDIVDYPGEWLLDLALLDKDYAGWSQETLARLEHRDCAQAYLAAARAEDGAAKLDEPRARALTDLFTAYLEAARVEGWSDLSPGRFLLPGDLAGSPVLTFAPLPPAESAGRGSLWQEMSRRFEAYKSRVVKPFFRDHFARIDRQVVLVDALGALHRGPRAVEDLRRTMAEILSAFRPGRNAFLTRVLLGKRVEKILFAATKADHLHHTQHGQLTRIMQALTRDAAERARFAGAQTEAMSLASLRATTEETIAHEGRDLRGVRGRLANGRTAVVWPGEFPDDPARLLSSAREGQQSWLDGDFGGTRFEPPRLSLRPDEGPPHIRLDRAAQFLFGDRL
ncbi:YcjX family GTP-binding protein [Litorisediminicola beolgyonensis]|uniref:YcjX family protein n=1 Tax=Litorisediminicola beolgyonensis TaxID=1173614 RepID=A0ABW3ZEX7_9RHOB